MKKPVLVFILCTVLLCSCSEKEENKGFETAVTAERSANAVTEEKTVSAEITAMAAAVTEPAEEKIILTPIPSEAPFEIPACDIIENAAVTEEEFAEKEIIKRAKGICFEAAHKNIEYYNDTVEKCNKIETAEDIVFSCGMALDFDGDGSDEYCLALDFRPENPMGGGALILMDGSECEIFVTDCADISLNEMKIILCAGHYFPMVTYYAGQWYSTDIYSFENDKPKDVLDYHSESHSITYENGVFYLDIRYPKETFPFVLCSDGVFRQLGREKISREEFEKHVGNGGAYLDKLAENGETITEIYTYGYYNYELYGENFRYDVFGNFFADDGTFLTEKADGGDASDESYFTDEVVYGDVWAAKPVRSPDEETAYELLDRFYDFYYSIQDFKISCHTDEENIKYYTEEDIMNGLCEFCTESAAKELLNTVSHSGQLYVKDGRYYSYDEAPSFFPPLSYIENAQEKDGVITAKLFSRSCGHDIPFIVYPPTYAEFTFEDGVWKISKLPEKFCIA